MEFVWLHELLVGTIVDGSEIQLTVELIGN